MIRTLLLIFVLVSSGSCATVSETGDLTQKGRSNYLLPLIKPFTPKRLKKAVYTHTLYKTDRAQGDCQPKCPLVDVWKYEYKPSGKPLLRNTKPIATRKAHWKVADEARIIAISHFDGNTFYFDGLLNLIDSFTRLKKVNGITDPIWGFETFTVRVYVARRNPNRLKALGEYADPTPDDQIQKLLSLGCEVAYVDNGLKNVKKDGTFWRFMVFGEEMPQGQRIRYLIRDMDWVMTGSEAFAVGEWIASGLAFHRNHQIPICLGPITACTFSGSHVGKGSFSNIRTWMESFPYRLQYGDDEMFMRDMLWPQIKYEGSVLTHTNHDWRYVLANPYAGSCEEPTQKYCDVLRLGGHCEDKAMPDDIDSYVDEIVRLKTYDELKAMPEIFDAHLGTERGKIVRSAMSTVIRKN